MNEPTRTDPGADSLPVRPGLRGLSRRDYEVVDEIGAGGMGRVWRARDTRLGRDVAIKQLVRSSASLRARFLREARVTAGLQHPAIVPIYEVGESDDGEPFYAMKLIAGVSMRESLEEARDYGERIALLPELIAVAEAVAYAHSRRVIHRDLKPDNVVLGAYGETLVVDWGLAKQLDDAPDAVAEQGNHDSGQLTSVGAVMGTPAYMPPEQARGEHVDERADVYAVGAMLYHVLAGAPPFAPGRSEDVLRQVLTTAPRPIAAREPRAPAELAAIVDKAMDPVAARRYGNAGELAADLKRFRTGKLVQAHSYSRRALVSRWIREHRTLATALAVGLCVAVAAGAWSFLREQQLRRGAELARDRAEEQSLALLTTQARTELRRGRPVRAATLLADAYRRDADNLAIQWMLRDALAVIDAYAGELRLDVDIVCVAFDPSGGSLATGDSSGGLTVWDARTLQPRATVRAHREPVKFVAFDPTGERLATSGMDGAVRLWRADGTALRDLVGHTGPVRTVAFSGDGARVVSASRDGTARIWDASTGAQLAALHFDGPVSSAEFRADGARVLVAAAPHDVSEWDANTGQRLRSIGRHTSVPNVAGYSPDGSRIATGCDDGVVRMWNADTGELVATFDGHDAVLSWLAFAPDGSWLATGAEDQTAAVWDVASGQRIVSVDRAARGVRSLAVSPNGAQLALASEQRFASVWDIQRFRRDLDQRVAVFGPRTTDVFSARFSEDGRRVIAAGADRMVRVWDVSRRALALEIDTGYRDGVWIAAPSRDGTRIVTTAWTPDRGDHDVHVWDAHTGRRVAVLHGHTDVVYDASFDPSGERVVTASWDGSVRQWDARTGAPVGAPLVAPPRRRSRVIVNQHVLDEGVAMMTARYSPGGTRIATGGIDGAIRLWDAEAGTIVRELAGHDSVVGSVSFGPDGRALVSAGWDDRVAKVWDVADGALLHTLGGSSHRILWASFDRAGARVVTASHDEIGRIYDARTGRIIAEIPGARYAADFSPDGTRMVVAGTRLWVWDVSLVPLGPLEVTQRIGAVTPWSLRDGQLQWQDVVH